MTVCLVFVPTHSCMTGGVCACVQAAREAAHQQELETWHAQEAARAAAEAAEREKWLQQEAAQAALWQEAEAIKEAARQTERAAWTAVSNAEAQCTALQVEATQYVLSKPPAFASRHSLVKCCYAAMLDACRHAAMLNGII